MNLEVGIVIIIDVIINNSLRPSNLYRKQGLYYSLSETIKKSKILDEPLCKELQPMFCKFERI